MKKKPDGVHRLTIDNPSFRNANLFKREIFQHNLFEMSCQYNCIFFTSENGGHLTLEKGYKISHGWKGWDPFRCLINFLKKEKDLR
jgi:hypothetical protein